MADDPRLDLAPTMSAEPVTDPSDASQAVLSDQIRRRLGSLLAAAYAQEDVEMDAAGHFADLLAKLDVALGRAHSCDEAEFQGQFLAVAPSLRRFAISLARDPTAADDLVQDTLLRAWRSRARFEPGTNFEAWTFTILRNAFYSGQRKAREVEDDDGSYTARLAIPPDQAGRLDLQDVRNALGRLAPVMREALVLVTIEDMSYDEAAAVMGCQVGTVKSRVWRARDQLTRALGYTGAEIGSDGVMLSALAGPGEISG